MSMNLYLRATIEAVSKVGKHTLTEEFGVYQTPTEVSYRLVNSSNIPEAYIQWAREFEDPYYEDVYGDEDIFQEKAPVGVKMINEYEEHVKALRSFLESHEGWNIKWGVC